MKRKNNDKAIKNEARVEAETLNDLPITEQQADRTRGGADSQGRLLMGHDNGIFR